jgi:hypothetical protein
MELNGASSLFQVILLDIGSLMIIATIFTRDIKGNENEI